MFNKVQRKGGLKWSVHRPGAIFGFSPACLLNMARTLSAYATISKYEGASIDVSSSTSSFTRSNFLKQIPVGGYF